MVQVIQIVLKILAAILKLVLFIQVREIIKTGRLAYFMRKIAEDEVVVAHEFESKPDEHKAAVMVPSA